mgnify:FL=1
MTEYDLISRGSGTALQSATMAAQGVILNEARGKPNERTPDQAAADVIDAFLASAKRLSVAAGAAQLAEVAAGLAAE